MGEAPRDPRLDRVLYATVDPTVEDPPGRPVPALTTLLYRVCGNDDQQFEEATRVVELFVTKALEVADRG